jgi:hypothetical protein
MMTAQQVGGRPKMGEEKLVIRSEKARFIDILSMLFLRRPITSYDRFVDAGDQTAADFSSTPGDWFVALTQVIQKALAAAYYPAIYIGAFVEFLLNFIVLNNGILGIIWNIFRCTYTLHTRVPMIHIFTTLFLPQLSLSLSLSLYIYIYISPLQMNENVLTQRKLKVGDHQLKKSYWTSNIIQHVLHIYERLN